MATTSAPSLCRHASGKARVRLSGKDFYGPAFGPGRNPSREAQAWYDDLVARWLANGRRLPEVKRPTVTNAVLAATEPDASTQITVAEVAAGYLQHARENFRRADGTVTNTHKAMKCAFRYLEPWYRLPAVHFTVKELCAVRKHIVETGGRRVTIIAEEGGNAVEKVERLPPARGYVNDVINRVKAAFAWASTVGLVPGTVVHEISGMPALRAGRNEGARETEPVEGVADTVFFATLTHLPPMPRDILRLLRACGARPGEICNMRPREIATTDDHGREIIAVDDQGAPEAVWILEPSTHKTWFKAKARTIVLGSVIQRVLTPYLEGRPGDAFVFNASEGEMARLVERRARRKAPVTPSARKKQKKAKHAYRDGAYTVSALEHAISRVCKKHNLPHWTPNQVRHSTLQETSDIFDSDTAQAVGGHSDPKSTQRYARPSVHKGARAVVTLGKKHEMKLLTQCEK